MGIRGGEIAEYLKKDPPVIIRYLRDGKRFETDIERVHENLKKQKQ